MRPYIISKSWHPLSQVSQICLSLPYKQINLAIQTFACPSLVQTSPNVCQQLVQPSLQSIQISSVCALTCSNPVFCSRCDHIIILSLCFDLQQPSFLFQGTTFTSNTLLRTKFYCNTRNSTRAGLNSQTILLIQ